MCFLGGGLFPKFTVREDTCMQADVPPALHGIMPCLNRALLLLVSRQVEMVCNCYQLYESGYTFRHSEGMKEGITTS